MERKDYLKTAELKRLFAAVKRHDAQAVRRRETWTGQRPFDPVGPFLAFVLLTGMRRGEALALTWDDLDLDALDANGNKVGEIYVRASGSKTSKARTVGLEVSPALRRLLAAQRLATGGKGKVWPQSKGGAVAAHRAARRRVWSARALRLAGPTRDLRHVPEQRARDLRQRVGVLFGSPVGAQRRSRPEALRRIDSRDSEGRARPRKRDADRQGSRRVIAVVTTPRGQRSGRSDKSDFAEYA